MNNLPIVSNNSQPPTKAANKSQSGNNSQGAEAAKPFGSVLAQQIEKPRAQSPATPQSEKTAKDAKKTADAKGTENNSEQDKSVVAPAAPTDPTATLAVMLQLPQEIKTPIPTTPANSAATSIVATDNAAATSTTATTLGEMVAAKPVTGQSALNALAAQANAKTDQANIPSGQADATAMLADNPRLRPQLGSDTSKNIVLPENIPSAAQSTQAVSQSAASLAASGMMPNTLTNNKPVDNPTTISAPVGSTKWGDEFAQKISWVSTQQNQVAELHLNPPDLGPLDVVLKITDNQATALFTSPHSAVRDAVENALPKLREILADSGITLGNTTVSDQTPRDNNPGGFSDQRGNSSAARNATGGVAESGSSSLTGISSTVTAQRHNGMVDTFA